VACFVFRFISTIFLLDFGTFLDSFCPSRMDQLFYLVRICSMLIFLCSVLSTICLCIVCPSNYCFGLSLSCLQTFLLPISCAFDLTREHYALDYYKQATCFTVGYVRERLVLILHKRVCITSYLILKSCFTF